MNLYEKKKFIINFSYFAMWFLLVLALFKVSAVYLMPFLISIIISIIVQKPAIYISSKLKIKKETCAALFSIMIFITGISIITLMFWMLYSQIETLINSSSRNNNFVKNIESLISALNEYFRRLTNNNAILDFVKETENGMFKKLGDLLSNLIANILKKIPSLFISCVITIVLTYYFSKDFDRLKKFIKGIVSENAVLKIRTIKNVLFDCVFKITIGYFWLFLITFFQLFIGFFILSVPNFFVYSFLISLIDLLPVIGTGAILLPWSIFEIFQKNYKLGFGLIILYVIIAIIRNFLEPKIIGKQTGINPLFMLIFIFLGLKIGGIIGMIFIPITFTVAFNYFKKQTSLSN